MRPPREPPVERGRPIGELRRAVRERETNEAYRIVEFERLVSRWEQTPAEKRRPPRQDLDRLRQLVSTAKTRDFFAACHAFEAQF